MATQDQDGKRKRAEEALWESEERFRLLVENAPGAIFVQTQHRFAFLNPAALRCFGAESPGQLLGQPVLDRFDARLQAVREEERTSVAREIHDVLAQELTRLKIDLVWLERRLTKFEKGTAPETLAVRVAEMSQMADTAINCVQRIATGLRPAVLDSLGLCAAVEWQARDFQAHAGIPCHASVPVEELPVGRDAATATFRILQESLTNVQRHAHATRVDVSLGQEAGQLVLRVEDNGGGVRAETLNSPMSIGLAGMRERALLLGGKTVSTYHTRIWEKLGVHNDVELVHYALEHGLEQGRTKG